MKHSCYNLVYDLENQEKMIYNTRTLGLSVLDKEEYIAFCNLDEEKTSLMTDLYESGFIIDDDCDEIKLIKYRLNSKRYSGNELRLVIAPTLGCNFSCIYCYEKAGEKKTDCVMNTATCEKIVDFVKKRSEIVKELEVIWYGGEPLIGIQVVEKLSLDFLKICKERGIIYTSSMISNGYLLDDNMIQRIEKLGITTLQITIDGPQSVHDFRRALKNGKGTLQRIITNIEKCNGKVEIVVRVNLDKENVKNLTETVKEIKRINMPNLMVDFANVIGSVRDAKMLMSSKEFADAWLKGNDLCDEFQIRHNSYCLPMGAHYCDADNENAFVIDPNGKIYKCWNDIGNTERSIGDLHQEHCDFSSLYYEYMTYDATEDKKCKKCILLPICMGGCPFDRVNGNDRCPMYSYITKDIIMRLGGSL